MKEKFISNYLNIVMNNKSQLSEEDIEKIKYAIEGIYLTITKLLIIIKFTEILLPWRRCV